jgi:hypothetical protein
MRWVDFDVSAERKDDHRNIFFTGGSSNKIYCEFFRFNNYTLDTFIVATRVIGRIEVSSRYLRNSSVIY